MELSGELVVGIHASSIHCHQQGVMVVWDDGAHRDERQLSQRRRHKDGLPVAVIDHYDTGMEGTQPYLMGCHIVIGREHRTALHLPPHLSVCKGIVKDSIRKTNQEMMADKLEMVDIRMLENILSLGGLRQRLSIVAIRRNHIHAPVQCHPEVAVRIQEQVIEHQATAEYLQEIELQDEGIFHLII